MVLPFKTQISIPYQNHSVVNKTYLIDQLIDQLINQLIDQLNYIDQLIDQLNYIDQLINHLYLLF